MSRPARSICAQEFSNVCVVVGDLNALKVVCCCLYQFCHYQIFESYIKDRLLSDPLDTEIALAYFSSSVIQQSSFCSTWCPPKGQIGTAVFFDWLPFSIFFSFSMLQNGIYILVSHDWLKLLMGKHLSKGHSADHILIAFFITTSHCQCPESSTKA